MTKLKCWKNFENKNTIQVFWNSKRLEQVMAFKDNNNWEFNVGKREGREMVKKFKTKSESLKFANKYMKKHDRC